jgi:hypothetical protein
MGRKLVALVGEQQSVMPLKLRILHVVLFWPLALPLAFSYIAKFRDSSDVA